MKKLVLLTILAVSLVGSGQLFGSGIGIKGGLNFSSIPSVTDVWIGRGEFNSSHWLELQNDPYRGYHFGVFASIRLRNLFLQPELLYSETGQKMAYKVDRTNQMIPQRDYFTPVYSHVKFPVLAGINLGPLRFGGGPVFSYLLDSTQGHLADLYEEVTYNYKKSTLGFQLIAGLRLGNLRLDFKYEDNLGNVGTGISIGGHEYEFDMRPRQYIISLGIVVF